VLFCEDPFLCLKYYQVPIGK